MTGRYDLVLLEKTASVLRLQLTPKSEVGEILELAVSPDTFDLQSLLIRDPGGSVTQLNFEGVRRGLALDEDLFRFAPPAGVDIIIPVQGEP